MQLRKMWKVKMKVILRVVGSLGTVPKVLEKNLRNNDKCRCFRRLHTCSEGYLS